MLFNDQIKKHWIEKIEELGDRFDPDCGNSIPNEITGQAAPLCLLTGLYGDDCLWSAYSKEFQLPRWILELTDEYMHNVSPETSKEDLLKVINACPTYKDLDLAYNRFAQKVIIYLLQNFSDIPAQLNQNYYFSTIWADMLTKFMLQEQRKEVPSVLEKSNL